MFTSVLTAIFGDYAIIAPMEMFIATHAERHPTEIARLRGARLVIAHETQKGRRWDESKLKTLTGGDAFSGRFMHGNFFDFTPTHKFIIAGNHKPGFRTVDEAIRRRFLLVPFTVCIPEEERDKHFAEKLKAEGPAILRWMVDGCLEWQCDGLMVPDKVRVATDEYLADQDVIAQWLDECTEADAEPIRLRNKPGSLQKLERLVRGSELRSRNPDELRRQPQGQGLCPKADQFCERLQRHKAEIRLRAEGRKASRGRCADERSDKS